MHAELDKAISMVQQNDERFLEKLLRNDRRTRWGRISSEKHLRYHYYESYPTNNAQLALACVMGKV